MLAFHFVISSLFIFLCWLVVIRTRLRLHTSAWALPAQSRTSAKCSRRTSSSSRPSRQTGRHSFAFSSYRSVSLQTVLPYSLVLNAVMFVYIFLYTQNIVSFTTVDRSKPISCKETSAEIESGEKCQVFPLFWTARHKNWSDIPEYPNNRKVAFHWSVPFRDQCLLQFYILA